MKLKMAKLNDVTRYKYATEKKIKPIYVNLKSLKKHQNAHPKETADNAWGEIHPLDGEFFYPLDGYNFRYMLSNFGRLINTSDGTLLPTCPGKGKRVCQINNEVYIDGYEYRNGEWRRTIRAILHCLFYKKMPS